MSGNNNKTVFVADVSKNMLAFKENIVRELKNSGCSVKEASFNENKSDQIREIIEQCDITLHILSDDDFDLDDSGRGGEELQIGYAVQQYLSLKLVSNSSDSRFKIYAWHAKSSSANIFNEERIPKHLRKIQQLEEVDLIRTNFEDFKYYLLKEIEDEPADKLSEFYIKGNSNLSIYLLFDVLDKEDAEVYVEYLKKRGYAVLTPIFDEDIKVVRKRHSSNLKSCDIAIVLSRKSHANWIIMKIMDILKAPGLGRDKKIKGKAVFLTDLQRKALPPISKGFKLISIESGTPKDHIENFMIDLPQ